MTSGHRKLHIRHCPHTGLWKLAYPDPQWWAEVGSTGVMWFESAEAALKAAHKFPWPARRTAQ